MIVCGTDIKKNIFKKYINFGSIFTIFTFYSTVTQTMKLNKYHFPVYFPKEDWYKMAPKAAPGGRQAHSNATIAKIANAYLTSLYTQQALSRVIKWEVDSLCVAVVHKRMGHWLRCIH